MEITETLADGEFKVFLDRDLVDDAIYSIALGVVSVYSSRCPGKVTPNEDAALVLPCGSSQCVLAVADGAGGERAGNEASNRAVNALKCAIERTIKNGGELRTGILNGFEEANRSVMDLNVGAATTLAVVEIQGSVIRPYHVGDSLIFVLGQQGKEKLETISHSPIGYALESGFIDEKEAMCHEERHLVSNLIGSLDMHIAIGPKLSLAPRDTLLIASDGVSDNLHKEEIRELIRKGSLAEGTKQLAEKCITRMQNGGAETPSKPDDLTFIIYRRLRAEAYGNDCR